MLDRLETEILSLRERVSAETHPPADTRTQAERKRSSKAGKRTHGRKKSKVSARPRRVEVQESLPLTEVATPDSRAPEPAPRIVGKRQALGRSLTQLRKMTARAAGLNTGEEKPDNSAEKSEGNSA